MSVLSLCAEHLCRYRWRPGDIRARGLGITRYNFVSAKNLESNQGKTNKLTNSAVITEATAIDNFNWGNKLYRSS